MLRYLLVRHGQTAWNDERRFQGHGDPPLNEKGLHQASLLRQRLADTAIDAVYASDRQRAQATAAEIVRGRGLTVTGLESLREMSFGAFEGFTYAEAAARYPAACAAWIEDVVNTAPPQGENLLQLASRIESFLGEVRASHPAGTVLVVAHEGPLRLIVSTLLGLEPTSSLQLHLDNASLSIVDSHGETAILSLLNDTCHLHPPAGTSLR